MLKAPARNSITIAKRTQLFPPSSAGSRLGRRGARGRGGAGIGPGLLAGGGAAAAGGGLAGGGRGGGLGRMAGGGGWALAAWACRWAGSTVSSGAEGPMSAAIFPRGAAARVAPRAAWLRGLGRLAGACPWAGSSVPPGDVRSFPATIFPRPASISVHVVRHVAAQVGFVADGTGLARARPARRILQR